MNALHEGQPVLAAGDPLPEAGAAMLLVHGRGASASDILSSFGALAPPGWALIAPQAANRSWYPRSFIAPMLENQPWLDSALARLGDVLARIGETIPADRTILLGFSQGACLTLEFAARHPRPYGAVVGLSGGLIGPEGTTRDYPGTLNGVPVFLGCSDVDPHIPAARVMETAEVLKRLGGEVNMRLYPGMGHQVNDDEYSVVRGLVSSVAVIDQTRHPGGEKKK